MRSLCDVQNYYTTHVPIGYVPSFVDLRGNYLETELNQEDFVTLITASLQQMNVGGKGNI